MVMERIMWPLPNLMTTLSASLGVVYAAIGESHVTGLNWKGPDIQVHPRCHVPGVRDRLLTGAANALGYDVVLLFISCSVPIPSLLSAPLPYPFCTLPYPFCTPSLPLLYPFPTLSVPLPYPFCTPSLPFLYPFPTLSVPLPYPFCTPSLPFLHPFPTLSVPLPYPFCAPSIPFLYPFPTLSVPLPYQFCAPSLPFLYLSLYPSLSNSFHQHWAIVWDILIGPLFVSCLYPSRTPVCTLLHT